MGRENRLRIARIEAGTEAVRAKIVKPAKEPLLHCKKCQHLFPESKAREHIRICWPYPIKDGEPIPGVPITSIRIPSKDELVKKEEASPIIELLGLKED